MFHLFIKENTPYIKKINHMPSKPTVISHAVLCCMVSMKHIFFIKFV